MAAMKSERLRPRVLLVLPRWSFLFGRFLAGAKVHFDEVGREFVCQGRTDAILGGNYRLQGSILVEEFAQPDGTTEVRSVELAKLTSERFAVNELTPLPGLRLQVVYRKVKPATEEPSWLQRPLQRSIHWENADKSDQLTDGYVAYRATVDGAKWLIQINDFPAEILYTLLIDRTPRGILNNWSAHWHRPEGSALPSRERWNKIR